ncbi:MAG: lysylphosphatidylglycerol synthase transmembrane domain-containing protein [Candidatus Thorarchaeota archaeon]
MRYSRHLKQIARLIGIAIFIYIMLGIDVQNMLGFVFSIPPFFSLTLILSIFPMMILRGARWKVIAEGIDLSLSTKQATEALCLAHLAGLVIPGSFGDLIRIPYMKHKGNRVDRAIISILLDAIMGSVIPFTIGLLALAVILEINISIEVALIGCIWLVGGYISYRILRATLWSRFMKARLRRLMKDGIRGRAFFTLPSMLKALGGRRIAISLALAAMLFALYVSQAYLLAFALGMTIEWTYLAVTLGLTLLMMAIPVTIQGLGIREGVLLFMLTRLGIGPTLIVSFSLTLMAINITPAIAGFVIWMRNPFVDITDQAILDEDVVWPSFPDIVEG